MAMPVLASEASKGKGVMLFACGSRGDVQPFVALAAGLVRAGFRALVLTNANHVDFVGGFGLEACEVYPDTQEMIKSAPRLLECMKNGDFFLLFKLLAEVGKEIFPKSLRQALDAAERFKPDVILFGGLWMTGAAAVGAVHGVPACYCDFAGVMPSGSTSSFLAEPLWWPSLAHRALNRLLAWAMVKSEREGKHAAIADVCPEVMPDIPKNLEQLEITDEFRQGPMLIGTSSLLVQQAKDWAWDPVVTGPWVIGPEEQAQRMGRREEHFAGADALGLEAFLLAGPPPVYVGWGSMVCVSSEFMACTAIRALKLASLRGVVLGGWAELGPESLRAQPDGDALLDYAAKHVFFTRTAAHEWLFPRCAAIVHHGGAGTTAAAMRSGRPAVITPCGFDQPLNAKRVAATGAGLALPRLAKVTPEQLAAAMRRVVDDKAMVARAAEVGKALRAEDGVANAVRALDDFVANEVVTGTWAVHAERRRELMRKYESPSLFTKIGFLCAKLCTNSIKSQVRW